MVPPRVRDDRLARTPLRTSRKGRRSRSTSSLYTFGRVFFEALRVDPASEVFGIASTAAVGRAVRRLRRLVRVARAPRQAHRRRDDVTRRGRLPDRTRSYFRTPTATRRNARCTDHASPPDDAVAARAAQATKIYGQGETAVRALDEINVEFDREQFTAIMGPSGSGKSTLLHCLAGLDRSRRARCSSVTSSSAAAEKQLTQVRRDKIGFVFQAYNLIPTLTALENITLPDGARGPQPDQAWLDQVIDTVGLRDRLKHRPSRALRRSAAARCGRRALAQQARDHLRRRADRQPRLQVRAPRS